MTEWTVPLELTRRWQLDILVTFEETVFELTFLTMIRSNPRLELLSVVSSLVR